MLRDPGENYLGGTLKVMETGEPIPGLVIAAYDVDPARNDQAETFPEGLGPSFWVDFPGQRLGSVATDAEGRFELLYQDDLFFDAESDGNRPRPDLTLFVMAPEDVRQQHMLAGIADVPVGDWAAARILYWSREIRRSAGRVESFNIRLPRDVIEEYAIPLSVDPVDRPGGPASFARALKRQTAVAELYRGVAETRVRDARQSRVRDERLGAERITPYALSSRRPGEGTNDRYIASYRPSIELVPGLGAPVLSRYALREDARASLLPRINFALPLWLAVEPRQPFQFRVSEEEARSLGLPDLELGANFTDSIRTERAFEHVTRTVREAMQGRSGPLERFKRRRQADRLVADAVRAPVEDPSVPAPSEPPSPRPSDSYVDAYDREGWVDRVAGGLTIREEVGGRLEDAAQVTANAGAFNLRASPSDVPSFHDYLELQIALPHVWTELFNQNILDAGQKAYQRVVKLADADGASRPTARIDTIDDLLALTTQDVRGGGATERPDELVSILLPELTAEQWSQLSEADRAGMVELATGFGRASAAAAAFGPPEPEVAARLAREKLRIQRELRARLGAGLLGALGETILDLESELLAPHKFDVFAEDSVNFGLMTTLRQRMRPVSFQAGALKKTITLTPGETIKITTKIEQKKSRKVLEKENASVTRRQENEVKGRFEKELAQRVEEKTDFKSEAEASGSIGAFSASGSVGFGHNSGSVTEAKRRSLRETTKKEAEEIKKETSTSIEFNESLTREVEISQTLTNSNQEIAVTWLFFELQRQFAVSERVHSVEPVVLIANAMPAPHELTPAWLMARDWCLRPRLLDDQFLDAMDYLARDFTGERAQLRFLHGQLAVDLEFLDKIEQEQEDIAEQIRQRQGELEGVQKLQVERIREGRLQRRVEAGREAEENVEAVLDDLEQEFNAARSRAQQAYAAYRERVATIGELMRRVMSMDVEVRRYAIHIAQNISYYMQGCWETEPQDQRFLRLHDIKIPLLDVERGGNSPVRCRLDPLTREMVCDVELPSPTGLLAEDEWPTAGELADLGNILGFFGNYGVYRLKEPHLLTTFMGRGYTSQDGIGRVGDAPSQEELLDCFREIAGDWRAAGQDEIPQPVRAAMTELLTAGLDDPGLAEEMIVLPMDALFIEALPAKHPVLEDFKLLHRAHDVRKAEVEALIAETELGRRLELLREGTLEPEPGKIIRVDGPVSVNVDDEG